MNDCISLFSSPSEKTLRFLQAFARLYQPDKDNEAEARRDARLLANDCMPC